jgi:hypothetical protein
MLRYFTSISTIGRTQEESGGRQGTSSIRIREIFRSRRAGWSLYFHMLGLFFL